MKHPAKYTDSFLPIFFDLLKNTDCVLDPMAGTGKLALIKDYGYKGAIICNDLEPDWQKGENYNVDEWHFTDASNMNWAKNEQFDAICTSPTYGNRMADNFVARDKSHRVTYRHYLGHCLKDGNTGKMQFGSKYCEKHRSIYAECLRVLKKGGIFIVNISNHIRSGKIIDVDNFDKSTLLDLGLLFQEEIKIKTPRMGFGANSKLRVDTESILVFIKDGTEN